MDPRLLDPFLAVVDEGSFVRAAARVHLSQPGLTHAVARLEHQLGVRLLDRTTRRVEPTPAGIELARHARQVRADLEHAVESVRTVAAGATGVVRIGVVGSAVADVVPRVARAVAEREPGVDLRVVEAVGADQAAGLAEDSLDLGVVHARRAFRGLRVTVLSEEPLSVAVPADHRLAHRTVVRLAELDDTPLVAIRAEEVADTRHLYVDACRAAGFEPSVIHDAWSLQGMLGLVSAGTGWAFVARPVVHGVLPPGIRVLRLHGCEQTLPVAAVWAPDRLAPVARRVLDLLRESASGDAGPAGDG